MQLIADLLEPSSSIPLTREQCFSQKIGFPSNLVTTKSGIKAAVYLEDHLMIACVPSAAIEEDFKHLQPRTLYQKGKGLVATDVRLIDFDRFHGIVIHEGGRCVVQVSL